MDNLVLVLRAGVGRRQGEDAFEGRAELEGEQVRYQVEEKSRLWDKHSGEKEKTSTPRWSPPLINVIFIL